MSRVDLKLEVNVDAQRTPKVVQLERARRAVPTHNATTHHYWLQLKR